MPLGAAPPQSAKLVPDSPAYQEFKRLIQEYVKKQSPATKLRSTKNRKEIEERQRELLGQALGWPTRRHVHGERFRWLVLTLLFAAGVTAIVFAVT
jgi:hypothetical protein